jgi:hypothetical protein
MKEKLPSERPLDGEIITGPRIIVLDEYEKALPHAVVQDMFHRLAPDFFLSAAEVTAMPQVLDPDDLDGGPVVDGMCVELKRMPRLNPK